MESALLDGISQSIEEQLWSALRAMEEATMLLESIGHNFIDVGNSEAEGGFLQKSKESRRKSTTIRHYVLNEEMLSEDGRLAKEGNGLKV